MDKKSEFSKPSMGVIIFTIVVILGIIFYWFAYRPSSIKKQCAAYAKTNTKTVTGNVDVPAYEEEFNRLYSQCLKEQGL